MKKILPFLFALLFGVLGATTNDVRFQQVTATGAWPNIVVPGANAISSAATLRSAFAIAGITGTTTSTAIATGTAAQGFQTPSATSTLSSAGNMQLPGTLTAGFGGTTAGGYAMVAGTAVAAPSNSVGFQAPTSVSGAFMMTLPGAPTTGFLLNTGTTDPSAITFVGFTGTGNVVRDTAPNLVSLGVNHAPTATQPIYFNAAGTGTTGTVYGEFLSTAFTAGGNSMNFYGHYISGTLTKGSFTSLVYASMFIDTPVISGAGTADGSYQLYIAAGGTATNKYGIYQVGTDLNVFSGPLQTLNVTVPLTSFTYASTMTVDFSGAGQRLVSLTGDVTFASSNLAAGRAVTLYIVATGGARALAFPAGWIPMGAAKPTSLASGKHAVLTLSSSQTTDANVYMSYAAEP